MGGNRKRKGAHLMLMLIRNEAKGLVSMVRRGKPGKENSEEVESGGGWGFGEEEGPRPHGLLKAGT